MFRIVNNILNDCLQKQTSHNRAQNILTRILTGNIIRKSELTQELQWSSLIQTTTKKKQGLDS